MNVNASIIGLEPIQARLRAVGSLLQNPRPMLKEIGEKTVESTKLRIKSGGPAPDGTPWDQLSIVTRMMRANRLSGGKGIYTKDGKRTRTSAYKIIMTAKPLLDTGRLRNSITKRVDSDSSVFIGTNVEYAAIQQFGGMAGRNRKVRIPARPYLGFSQDDQAEIIDIIARRIKQAGGMA